jgi:hypothetical protein
MRHSSGRSWSTTAACAVDDATAKTVADAIVEAATTAISWLAPARVPEQAIAS